VAEDKPITIVAMTYNPSDAHILGGLCALCDRAQPAGLLTLRGDQWAPPVRCTNGKRDTIVACEPCAAEWKRLSGNASIWRPWPRRDLPRSN
jgi:hypothetical protein